MNLSSIRKSILLKLFLLPLLISLSGCIYVVVGGVGVLGGYIVSPDTVEGVVENDMISAWETAVDVVSIMGTIQEEYESSGIILAQIHRAKVIVTLTSLSDSAVKVNVKARKTLFPRISIAQDVYAKVVSRLNE